MSVQAKMDEFNERVIPEGWAMQLSHADTTPVLSRGLSYLDTEADLLLAMCLNNGYYDRHNVYRMLKFALSFSNRVHIFTTDGPAKHNYEALGKAKEKIPAITRLARNRLRNQCTDALKRVNADRSEDEQYSVVFLEWEDIYRDQSYIDSYKALKDLYANNPAFQKDINDTSTRVLLHRIGIKDAVEKVLHIGIEYVIEELAFIVAYRSLSASAKLVSDHGMQGFSYLYYEPWPVFEKLVNGEYDGKSKDEIGFIIGKISEVTTSTQRAGETMSGAVAGNHHPAHASYPQA